MIAAPPADWFCAAATEEHVRHQDAHTRAWVSFDQEEDGFAQLMGLLNTQRREIAWLIALLRNRISPVQRR